MSQLTQKRFTAAEAAALSGLLKKSVHKEFDHRILSSSDEHERRLSLADLVYLRVLKSEEVLHAHKVPIRATLYTRIVDTLSERSNERFVRVGELLSLDISIPRAEMESLTKRFFQWKSALTQDPAVMNGEPVFPGSRVTVRHIGAIIERGEAEAVVREDYPNLTDEDVEFAPIFVQAYPRVGRPAASGNAPH